MADFSQCGNCVNSNRITIKQPVKWVDLQHRVATCKECTAQYFHKARFDQDGAKTPEVINTVLTAWLNGEIAHKMPDSYPTAHRLSPFSVDKFCLDYRGEGKRIQGHYGSAGTSQRQISDNVTYIIAWTRWYASKRDSGIITCAVAAVRDVPGLF